MIKNNIFHIASAIIILMMIIGCKNASIKPSIFLEKYIAYYISDSLNSYLNPDDYVIKVVTRDLPLKYIVDVIGFEKKQLIASDTNIIGISYYNKYKIIYYGDLIPYFTVHVKTRLGHIKYFSNENIEYDPIVFRIAIGKSNLDFLPEDSFKMNSMLDKQQLHQIVDQYLEESIRGRVIDENK